MNVQHLLISDENGISRPGSRNDINACILLRLTSLAIKQRNRSNRTPTTSPQLQREANKSKAALANNLVQIIEAFHMRHLTLTANVVSVEIHLALGTGTDRFNACDCQVSNKS